MSNMAAGALPLCNRHYQPGRSEAGSARGRAIAPWPVDVAPAPHAENTVPGNAFACCKAAMSASTLPMTLTVARIAAAPVVAGLILIADQAVLLWGTGASVLLYAAALGVFALAALTDAADGILARKLNAVTPLGAAMDHVADKALTTCTLIALCATVLSRDMIAAAILFIGRDVVIAGLREGLSLAGKAIPVSQGGKLKTALMLVSIGAVLLLQCLLLSGVAAGQEQGLTPINALDMFARLSLWAATILALWTGGAYVSGLGKKAGRLNPGGGSSAG